MCRSSECQPAQSLFQFASREEEVPAVAAVGAPQAGSADAAEEQGSDAVDGFCLLEVFGATDDHDFPRCLACGVLIGGGKTGEEVGMVRREVFGLAARVLQTGLQQCHQGRVFGEAFFDMQDLRAIAQALLVVFAVKDAQEGVATMRERVMRFAVVVGDVGGVRAQQAGDEGEFGGVINFTAFGSGAQTVNGEEEGGKCPGLGFGVGVLHGVSAVW